MRLFKRFLLLFCVLAVLLSSLSSCAGLFLLSGNLLEGMEIQKEQSGEEENVPANDQLAYTLTDADRQAFLGYLDELETLILEERSADEEKINEVNEKIETSYYHIATQAELAYIYHCLDETDTARSEAYLFASGMRSDVFNAYETTCKKIDLSDAPGKAVFFADWSEEDLEEMRGYSEEHTALIKANDQIEVAYRSLSRTEKMNQAPDLYLQIVENNQRIAALCGYENYAGYAYAKIYKRDYTPDDARQIHQSVKSTLLPACQNALAKFQEGYSALSTKERATVRALLEGEYSGAWDLMNGYFSSFSAEVETGMKSLFLPENHFLTNSKNADEGAFTTYLYDYERPICYFGPGYHDAYTILHELGHYYSAICSNDELEMDIAETQSQANEWLFTAYLQIAAKNETLAETVLYYQLYSALRTIVMSSIIDEFEQSVYSDPPESGEEFDARMREICQGYGGVDWVKSQFADPMRYWRLVVLESPCYYISYAFSMLASINFYELALKDYAAAQNAYLALAALELDEGETYCQWLEEQGMQTPFEASYYQSIARLAA